MPLSTVVPQSAADRQAALSLLFSPQPPEQRRQQLAEAFAAVERGELSLENLVMAVDGDQVLGTVLAVRRPGGAAFLWPPVVRAGAPAEVSQALLEFVAARVDAQQVQFTQCLLDPGDARGQAALDRGGFPRVTDLVLLSRSLAAGTPPPAALDLSFECYSRAVHPAFVRTIERTYSGTLDCPALARVRGGEESLAAHRATGSFAPAAWRIYRAGGGEVGMLLLAEHPERDMWEVVYLGVVPEARRRGIGRAMLREALTFAQRSGRSTIEIAVDADNGPALSLYRELGFAEVRRYGVHLRLGPQAR